MEIHTSVCVWVCHEVGEWKWMEGEHCRDDWDHGGVDDDDQWRCVFSELGWR